MWTGLMGTDLMNAVYVIVEAWQHWSVHAANRRETTKAIIT